jgi:two-component system sensor histidine kinase ChiS
MPPLNRRLLLPQNYQTRWLPSIAAGLTILAVFAVVLIFDRSEQKRFEQQTRADVLNQLSAVRASLESHLNQQLYLTRGIVSYVSGINPNLSQAEFTDLAKVIVVKQPNLYSIQLVKNYQITHIYPPEAARGFDMLSMAEKQNAVQQVIQAQQTVVVGPIQLVQGGMGLISRTPIFLNPSAKTPSERKYWGLVSLVINPDSIFKEAGLYETSTLQYAIRASENAPETRKVFFGKAEIFAQQPVILTINLPNRSWELAAIPQKGWSTRSPLIKWLWLGGSLLAGFAGTITYVWVRWPAQLQNAVDRATNALQKSENDLQQANRELKHLDRLKDEFLANTSHELRTPLNGMIGLAESLLDGAAGPISAEQQHNLVMIAQSGHRLATLVNDILDFSKLQRSTIELQPVPVGVREMVEVVLTLSRPLIKHKNIQLINSTPQDLLPVLADENRLQQILYNLIGNAIKFTQAGTVEISAKLLEKSPNSPEISVTVSDTGIGIAADKLDRIFESFEQGDGSTAREYGGTGLGLAITQKLVELHGGTIQVKSTVNQGSTFTFTLPAAQVSPEKIVPAKTSDQEPLIPIEKQSIQSVSRSLVESETSKSSETTPLSAQYQGHQFKILIVDDEPINLQVLVNHLSLENYLVMQASNGVEALQLLQQGFKPDLILLDVMMPKMTGYEVCQKLREHYPANELPVLMLTAKNQVTDLVVGLESGANDYLTKPISKNELLARIKTHLQLSNLTLAYSRFVPRQFLSLLNKESIIDVQLGDNVQQKMSILFSDIRDFTALSERMNPEENFKFINSYLSRMEPAINQNHGFIDKYIGDAIMALFNRSADDAVTAGIAMLEQLIEYNHHRCQSGYSPVQIGIGINTGSLMLGTVGGYNRMDGTVISDAVNLASRLEGLTKNYGVSLLISHHTFLELNEYHYAIRLIDRVKVKGKSEMVSVFEIFDADPPELKDVKLKTRTKFEEGLLLYSTHSFRDAAQCFQECLQIHGADRVAQIYLKRCQEHIHLNA